MVTKIFYPETKLDHKPTVLGPRLEGEIRRRIRELEARFPGTLTAGDRKELHKLKALLFMAVTGRSES